MVQDLKKEYILHLVVCVFNPLQSGRFLSLSRPSSFRRWPFHLVPQDQRQAVLSWQENPRNDAGLSPCSTSGVHSPHTNDVNPDHLVRLKPDRFLHHQVITLSLIMR